MDAFDCIAKNDPNLEGLPQELLDIIKHNYMKQLEEDTKKKIQVRSKNSIFTYVKEDIEVYGTNYLNVSIYRNSDESDIPESYNIVECVLKNKMFDELGLFPRLSKIRFFDKLPPTPEWLLQLQNRLYLKYESDFVFCLSQLKRLVGFFKKNDLDLSKIVQFGYNLGRLDEISAHEDQDEISDHEDQDEISDHEDHDEISAHEDQDEISDHEDQDEISAHEDHTIFWKSVERLFNEKDWEGLDAYIDTLQKRFQIGYDPDILAKSS